MRGSRGAKRRQRKLRCRPLMCLTTNPPASPARRLHHGWNGMGMCPLPLSMAARRHLFTLQGPDSLLQSYKNQHPGIRSLFHPLFSPLLLFGRQIHFDSITIRLICSAFIETSPHPPPLSSTATTTLHTPHHGRSAAAADSRQGCRRGSHLARRAPQLSRAAPPAPPGSLRARRAYAQPSSSLRPRLGRNAYYAPRLTSFLPYLQETSSPHPPPPRACRPTRKR